MWPGEVGGCGVEEVSGETLTENLSSELAVDSDSFRMVADAEVYGGQQFIMQMQIPRYARN